MPVCAGGREIAKAESAPDLPSSDFARAAPMDVLDRLSEALSVRPYELFLEEGVDANPDRACEDLRAFASELSSTLAKSIPQTIQSALAGRKKQA